MEREITASFKEALELDDCEKRLRYWLAEIGYKPVIETYAKIPHEDVLDMTRQAQAVHKEI